MVFRISLETGEKSLNAMRRNARTAYTGAQNAGRVEGMKQARDKLGIKVKKRWMAFLDSHTRDAHADLDGQVADVDEPFDSMLGPIMYPGDPEAEPANVYNCRCTLVYEYPEYPDAIDRVDEDGENVGDMSYSAWREMKVVHLETPGTLGEKAVPYSERGIALDERHVDMISRLQTAGDYITGSKDDYNVRDLAVLSRETGVEYTKITAGGKTYMLRGGEKTSEIPEEIVREIRKSKGTVDAHSHPYVGDLAPSEADKDMLKTFTWQSESVIIDPTGKAVTYTRDGVTAEINVTVEHDEHYYDNFWGE